MANYYYTVFRVALLFNQALIINMMGGRAGESK